MISARVKFVSFVFVALVFFVSVGCGPPEEPKGNLSGIVTSNGEPIGECVIGLYSASTKRTVGGKADLDGNYLVKDIPLGNYAVFVSQRTFNGAEPEPFDKRIPEKFRNRRTTDFAVDIKEGENEMDLKLEF